jgi:hypothetical protein
MELIQRRDRVNDSHRLSSAGSAAKNYMPGRLSPPVSSSIRSRMVVVDLL